MAALTITATSVIGGAGSVQQIAGSTITAGQVVRIDTATGRVIPAVNDTAANAAAYGVALNGAAVGQPVQVQLLKSGPITIGATVAVGKVYVLGTAGGIIPVDDIAGAEFVQFLGVGQTTAILFLGDNAGVAAAGAVS
jgi:hypothetical protein